MGIASRVSYRLPVEAEEPALLLSTEAPVQAEAPTKPVLRPIDLSVVIPTLNSAARLAETIGALDEARDTLNIETIVVDAGSNDDTIARAKSLEARVIEASRIRGVQLSAGAKEASGRWLLFLPAETTLEPFWSTTVTSFMRSRNNALKAAYFTFALDDASNAARRLEVMANWRARSLGLPHGEQGLLMSRKLYNSLVGYLDLPVMEDVDMARRIGKKSLVELPATATTCAKQFRKSGCSAGSLKGFSMLSLYFMGVSPRKFAKAPG